MSEQTDNQLRDRIREVFDNFEDPSAEEGWLLLREKYPKRKHRIIVWFWFPAAAATLLFVIGGVFFFSKRKSENLSYKPLKSINQLTIKDKTPKTTAGQLPDNQTTNLTSATKTSAIILKTLTGKTVKNSMAYQQPAFKVNRYAAKNNLLTSDNYTDPTKIEKPTPASDSIVIAQNNKTGQEQHGADSDVMPDHKNIIQKPLVLADNPVTKREVKKNNSTISTDKKVRFGIYAATYVNYSKGSNNLFNVGAGFSSDIRISKALTFSTGLALAQNTLNYTGTPTHASNDAYNAIVTANNLLNTGNNNSNTGISPITVLNTYNASLVALDIPINLKYDFGSAKHQSYILAGLSSGTFINQTYTYNYLSGQQSTTSSISKPFGDFYFAKVLNVSLGFGYPLGKTNNLIIEPFLKYPLGGLGDQQIKFGAGGLNLKFNFKPSKK